MSHEPRPEPVDRHEAIKVRDESHLGPGRRGEQVSMERRERVVQDSPTSA